MKSGRWGHGKGLKLLVRSAKNKNNELWSWKGRQESKQGRMQSVEGLDLELGNSPSSGGRRKSERFTFSIGRQMGFTFPDLRLQFLSEALMITVFCPSTFWAFFSSA